MSIFVSIACLLDNDIVNTVEDCFRKAKNTNNVTIGVCYQKDYSKPDILESLEKKYKNIKVVRISWDKAEGPMFARHQILSLIKDEEFFLQIDCHTRFFENWDEKIIEEYNKCLKISKTPVISYYPININNMNDEKYTSKIYHIAIFREISLNGVKSTGKVINIPKEPIKAISISAAMLFMKCKTVLENPIDPNLPFALQSGEQLLYAARLWTRGYDIFTPSQHILATEYITNKERIDIKYRSFLNGKASKVNEDVWKKTKYLLGLTNINEVPVNIRSSDIDKWREGTVRSLKQYYEMCEIYKKLKEIFPNIRI